MMKARLLGVAALLGVVIAGVANATTYALIKLGGEAGSFPTGIDNAG
jgi:hypothetical protein